MQDMFSQENISHLLLTLPIVLISVAIHEFAHCWMTDRLGDDTPRRQGRVTLNPFVHLDPIGTIMMVLSSLSGYGIGWGKPSPFNPYNFRHPARDRMITAIAGPLSNIFQMLMWAGIGLIIDATTSNSILITVCIEGIFINAGLATFNMIPIYPLDGHHIVAYLIPPLQPIVENQMLGYAFIGILLFTNIIGAILGPAISILGHFSAFLVDWDFWRYMI